jgi:hypothetical protein
MSTWQTAGYGEELFLSFLGSTALLLGLDLFFNIRIYLVEVGWGDVDWIGLAQDKDSWRALGNPVLNLRVP